MFKVSILKIWKHKGYYHKFEFVNIVFGRPGNIPDM